MSNSEQVTYLNMLHECQQSMFGVESTKNVIVDFHGEEVEVQVEFFNEDDEPAYNILNASIDGVEVLNLICCLGGLSELCEVVEKELKNEEH